jgi:hypothetical protein
LWEQIGDDINGAATGDAFGSVVSLSSDGDTVAVGALWNDANGSNSGHVTVFKHRDNAWQSKSAVGSGIRPVLSLVAVTDST